MAPQTNDAQEQKLPGHTAIIMDGNGRWARQRGLLRAMGHQEGAKAVTRVIAACLKKHLPMLTLFAFSSENWQRPASEVTALMNLLSRSLVKQRGNLHSNGIKVRVIGDKSALGDNLQKLIAQTEELTANNKALTLNIAINYGGQWDIAQAARALAMKVKEGLLDPDDIDQKIFSCALNLNCDVDLLIRTGGEHRISNFLLWQCAYSEFYVTDVLWPDFDEHALDEALAFYRGRERRFGKTSEQVRQS